MATGNSISGRVVPGARGRATSLTLLLVALLASLSTASAKGQDLPRPADPFADPRHDPYNPLRYIANNALTAVAFTLVVLVAVLQTTFIFKYGAKWMMAMTIGAYCFALGIGARFGLHSHPESKGIYIIEYLFVVLSPCAFIAADYVLLGRIARHIGAEAHLLIRPQRITIAFICSDVTTFLIQAGGGSSTISANKPNAVKAGENIFLAGLALQLASFFSFTCLYLRFLYRTRKYEPQAWVKDAHKVWYKDWRSLAGALLLSCVGILIRSVYRVIEISQGFEGFLATREKFFYGLDTLPLFIAIAIYVPFWPGRFIPRVPKIAVEKPAGDIEGAELGRTSANSGNTADVAGAPAETEKL